MTDETEAHRLRLAVDVWKTTVEVQQHFNTIEMQIRALAVTVLTAAIGAAVLASTQVQEAIADAIAAGRQPPPYRSMPSSAALFIGLGLFAWIAFYFMDRWWYHRLLQGAVSHAEAIEKELRADLSCIALAHSIRKASPFRFIKWQVHSDRKIDLFYGIVALLLVLVVFFVV